MTMTISTPNLERIAPGDMHTEAHRLKRRVEGSPFSSRVPGSIGDRFELARLEFEAAQEVAQTEARRKSDAEKAVIRDAFLREMERCLGLADVYPHFVSEEVAVGKADGFLFRVRKDVYGFSLFVGSPCPECGQDRWSAPIKAGTAMQVQMTVGEFMAKIQAWDCERDCDHETDTADAENAQESIEASPRRGRRKKTNETL